MAKSTTKSIRPRAPVQNITKDAPCACDPKVRTRIVSSKSAVGRGGRAAGVDPVIKAANLNHLRRIEGQVRGIAAMIEEDCYCADIIQQAAAAQESLRSVAKNLLKNHLLHCAARAVFKKGNRQDNRASREDMINEVIALVAKVVR